MLWAGPSNLKRDGFRIWATIGEDRMTSRYSSIGRTNQEWSVVPFRPQDGDDHFLRQGLWLAHLRDLLFAIVLVKDRVIPLLSDGSHALSQVSYDELIIFLRNFGVVNARKEKPHRDAPYLPAATGP